MFKTIMLMSTLIAPYSIDNLFFSDENEFLKHIMNDLDQQGIPLEEEPDSEDDTEPNV